MQRPKSYRGTVYSRRSTKSLNRKPCVVCGKHHKGCHKEDVKTPH